MDRLNDIAKHFAIEGEIAEIKPLGSGLINDTYKVTTKGTDTPDYVLQRINHHIFTDVDALQSNTKATGLPLTNYFLSDTQIKSIMNYKFSTKSIWKD